MSSFLELLDGVLDTTMMAIALAILLALIGVAVLYLIDVTQNTQAIRKNYPVIGRLRFVCKTCVYHFRSGGA